VIPDLSRIAVLSSGIWKGAIAIMPSGGHKLPISMLGARLLWKNAQKNLKKNSTSEVMKRIIPHRRPLTTQFVWNPCIDLSRDTSRHHCAIIIHVVRVLRAIRFMFFLVTQYAVPISIEKILILIISGHGLMNTIWYGWFCFIGFI
jgi:hypothetical protein